MVGVRLQIVRKRLSESATFIRPPSSSRNNSAGDLKTPLTETMFLLHFLN